MTEKIVHIHLILLKKYYQAGQNLKNIIQISEFFEIVPSSHAYSLRILDKAKRIAYTSY